MPRYAADTEVPVERSKAEIEGTVTRYGASGFTSGWLGSRAIVFFEMRDRRVKFTLNLPDRLDFVNYCRRVNATKTVEAVRTPEAAAKAWEQACRQRWRALALVVKAKLEAVEADISTFDEEFMAHIVLPNGLTIGEQLVPRMAQIASTGEMPPLLPDEASQQSRRKGH